MFYKNVASQKLVIFAFDTATGLPKTGDAGNLTAYVSKDHGTVTVLADTSATEMDATNAKGWYLFDVAQAETNADVLLFSGKSSTSGIVLVGVLIRTAPPNLSSLAINSSGYIKAQGPFPKNTAFAAFMFLMTDSTNHAPATGKTVTVTRSIDGGSFGAGTLGSVSEVGNGWYAVDFGAGDLNGNNIVFRGTATGCDDTFRHLLTER